MGWMSHWRKKWTLKFYNRLTISWLAERLLTSQKRYCSMESGVRCMCSDCTLFVDSYFLKRVAQEIAVMVKTSGSRFRLIWTFWLRLNVNMFYMRKALSRWRNLLRDSARFAPFHPAWKREKVFWNFLCRMYVYIYIYMHVGKNITLSL
jgi:hypothetical protein